jgi:hypothetical protein
MRAGERDTTLDDVRHTIDELLNATDASGSPETRRVREAPRCCPELEARPWQARPRAATAAAEDGYAEIGDGAVSSVTASSIS